MVASFDVIRVEADSIVGYLNDMSVVIFIGLKGDGTPFDLLEDAVFGGILH
jgi:hypothetical protein